MTIAIAMFSFFAGWIIGEYRTIKLAEKYTGKQWEDLVLKHHFPWWRR